MEFTILYNAYLIGDNFKQEYLDHPATVPILFLSFFLKFLNFIGLLSVANISDLNNSDFFTDNIQQGIYWTRIFQMLFSLIFLIYFYKCLYKFNKNRFVSIICLLILFSSVTFLDQATTIRSELYAVVFLFFSYIHLIFFFRNINPKISLFLSIFCIFVALISKIQIILYLPFILVFALILSRKEIILSKVSYKYLSSKIFFSLYFILTILGLFKLGEYHDQSRISFYIFLTFYFLCFFICSYHFIFQKNNKYQNLSIINTIFISSHLLFLIIIYLFPNVVISFFTFYNLRSIVSYSQFSINDASNISALNIFFENIQNQILDQIIISFNQVLFTFLLIFVFLLIFFKSLTYRYNVFLLITLIFVIYSKVVVNFRYDSIRYDIFILPFLIFNFSIIFKEFLYKKIFIFFNIGILFWFLIFNDEINKQRYRNYDHEFCKMAINLEYLDHWHKQINKDKVILFCKNSKMK